MSKKLGCIILAAGKSTRMKSDIPKPLHTIAGRSMISHVIAAAEGLNPDKIVVVTGADMKVLQEAVLPHASAVQEVANGTGGAALAAREHFKNFDGDILVIFGDHPLFTTDTMKKMVDTRRQLPSIGLVYSAMTLADPKRYGRMVMDDDGTLKKIVEYKDATEEERNITLCNGGLIAADGLNLFKWLDQVGNDNAQREYYLTDLPQIARKDNRVSHVVEISPEEMEAANTREELANLEHLMQNRLRKLHMNNGATLTDPASVFFSFDTIIGRDVIIQPNVYFGTGVTVADHVNIHAFSHIEGASIATGASIGPFARIRHGSNIGEDVKIGNFVETKNTTLHKGAKASHLTYLGDAVVGERSNIGAGVITCNYDGFMKHKTTIGSDAFVGSNSALIAPVTIGKGAFVAAGSTIGDDVPENALGITRAPQITKENWAPEYRQKKMREKASKKDS